MTTMDLFQALSAATDAQLTHAAGNTARRPDHKLLRHVLAAAAVLTLLVSGVFALHALRSIPVQSTASQSAIAKIYVSDGEVRDIRYSVADIMLELTPNADAPARITRFYAPEPNPAQWTPLPLTLPVGQTVDPGEQGVLLRWQRSDGAQLTYRQMPMRCYTPGISFDQVCTGFNADYRIEACTLGGVDTQRLTVLPSEAVLDGGTESDPGFQKLYWSDGDYLFTLEADASVTEAELSELLAGIREVDDIDERMRIAYYEPADTEAKTLDADQILFPSAGFGGYTLATACRQPNGGYLFIWQRGNDPLEMIALTVEPLGTNAELTKYFDTALPLSEHETLTVGSLTVECYREQTGRTRLFWTDGTADYLLDVGGIQVPAADTLLGLIADMQLTSPDAFLLQ